MLVSSIPKGTPVRCSLFFGLAVLVACCSAPPDQNDDVREDELNVSDVYTDKDFSSASLSMALGEKAYQLGVFRTCFASPSVATITEHASNIIAQEHQSMNDPGVFVRVHTFTERGETQGSVLVEDGNAQFEYEGSFELEGPRMSAEGQFTKSVKQSDGSYQAVGQVDGSILAAC